MSITLICGLTKYTIFHGSPKFHFRWKDYFMRKNKRVSQKCKQNISCISQSYLRIENASCNQMMCGCIIHLSRKGFSMHKIFQAGSFVFRIKDLSFHISYTLILSYMETILFLKVLRVKRSHLNFHSDSVWCILNEILKHCCHVLSIWRCKTQKYKVFPQTCIIFCVRNFLLITFCTLHKHVSLKLAQYQYIVYLIHNVKTEVVVA